MRSVWRVVEIALGLQREAARAAARKAEHTAREAEQIAREAYRAGSTARRASEGAIRLQERLAREARPGTWKISYYADVEGDWTVAPLDDDYPTLDAAHAAWVAAYRGEDEFGNSAYPCFTEEPARDDE